MTGYLTYDANVARLDDLHRRAGRRPAVRDAVTRTRACGTEPVTIRRATDADAELVELLSLRAGRLRAATNLRRLRRRPRWAYRTA